MGIDHTIVCPQCPWQVGELPMGYEKIKLKPIQAFPFDNILTQSGMLIIEIITLVPVVKKGNPGEVGLWRLTTINYQENYKWYWIEYHMTIKGASTCA